MNIKDENINKIKRFLDYDLRIKEIFNYIMPKELDFYDNDSKFNYTERLLDGIDRINMYLCKMMIDYNIPVEIIEKFDKHMHMIDSKINSKEFSDLLNKGYNDTLGFINRYISFMRVGFKESVRNGFKGYYINYGKDVIEPYTVNEYLHYVHNYVINKEDYYEMVPKVRWVNDKDFGEISLRGISNDIGIELYQKLIEYQLDSDCIDIINLDKFIVIMARDLGHAAVIEIDLSDINNIFVKYFIPKNTNVEKSSLLRGIYTNNSKYASGEFLTNRGNFANDICNFMSGIPTDYDLEFVKNSGYRM